MGKVYTKKFYLLGLLAFLMISAKAQVFLGTSPFIQNFDTIGTNGLPNGFTVRTGATYTALGTPVSLTTTATSWFSTSGRFSNDASATVLTASTPATTQNTTVNRALGVRQTGSFGDPGAALVFQAVNTKCKKNFALSFNLQSLDTSSLRSTTFLVQYAKGTNPNSFTTLTTSPTP
jgi:hypothetical protein